MTRPLQTLIAALAMAVAATSFAGAERDLHWPEDRKESAWAMSCGLVSMATVEALLSADWYVDASIYLWRVCHDKEGARMIGGTLVDRIAVRRHDAQRRPGAQHAQIGQPGPDRDGVLR